MKYKKILLFFLIALPLSIGLRLIQLLFTVEAKTGFFLPEFEKYGVYILVIIFAFSILTAIFAFSSHRSPQNAPKPNIFMSVSAVLLSLSVFYEINNETFPLIIKEWQRNALFIFAVATGVFFILFSAQRFIDFKLPRSFFIIPTVYFVARVVCYFTATSSLALISDNLILMATYIAILIFMLQFTKLYNNIDTERNFRKLMASGFASVIFCFTQSLPHIIMNFVTDFGYQHTSMIANITILFTGIFILAFCLSHFSYKNACE